MGKVEKCANFNPMAICHHFWLHFFFPSFGYQCARAIRIFCGVIFPFPPFHGEGAKLPFPIQTAIGNPVHLPLCSKVFLLPPGWDDFRNLPSHKSKRKLISPPSFPITRGLSCPWKNRWPCRCCQFFKKCFLSLSAALRYGHVQQPPFLQRQRSPIDIFDRFRW